MFFLRTALTPDFESVFMHLMVFSLHLFPDGHIFSLQEVGFAGLCLIHLPVFSLQVFPTGHILFSQDGILFNCNIICFS